MATFGPCVLSDWVVGGAQSTELIELVLKEKNREYSESIFFPSIFIFCNYFCITQGQAVLLGRTVGVAEKEEQAEVSVPKTQPE